MAGVRFRVQRQSFWFICCASPPPPSHQPASQPPASVAARELGGVMVESSVFHFQPPYSLFECVEICLSRASLKKSENDFSSLVMHFLHLSASKEEKLSCFNSLDLTVVGSLKKKKPLTSIAYESKRFL